jgi:hypothetical protein
MARICGVNLSRAVVEGWLPRAELDGLVARCATCRRTAACEGWLARSGALRAMPDFCPNKLSIEALSP